jgi:hypothetical protein
MLFSVDTEEKRKEPVGKPTVNPSAVEEKKS